jgi:hypothetical protein
MIRLINGAEIWFRSIGHDAELIRGFQFDLINIDEAGYVTSEMAIKTLRGRLLGVNPVTRAPLKGLFWQMTSPKARAAQSTSAGRRVIRASLAQIPNATLSLRVKTFENPLLDKDVLREIMADYSERMIRQELEGEFPRFRYGRVES